MVSFLRDDAEPEEQSIVANFHLQVAAVKHKLLQNGASNQLIRNTGTRAARYNTGRCDQLPDAKKERSNKG